MLRVPPPHCAGLRHALRRTSGRREVLAALLRARAPLCAAAASVLEDATQEFAEIARTGDAEVRDEAIRRTDAQALVDDRPALGERTRLWAVFAGFVLMLPDRVRTVQEVRMNIGRGKGRTNCPLSTKASGGRTDAEEEEKWVGSSSSKSQW
jgi:hypothetical protein